MSIEANKNTATQFFTRFNSNDMAGALDLMSDDVSYWVAGDPERLAAAGTHNKESIAQVFLRMGKALKDGLRMTIKSVIAEGDIVACEVESYGELKNGRIYNNQYYFQLSIRDGKISSVREYMDTHHVFVTWYQDSDE